MSDEQELPDLESIILPEDIPLPDDIPLPPEDIPLPPDDIPLPPDQEYQAQKSYDHIQEQLRHPEQQYPLPPSPPSLPQAERHHNRDRQAPLSHSPPNRDEGQRPRKRRRHKGEDDDEGIKSEALKSEEELMARMMGFSSFNTTKGKMVPGNQSIGAVHVVKKQRCRQYMNRRGGFNRPLDKTA